MLRDDDFQVATHHGEQLRPIGVPLGHKTRQPRWTPATLEARLARIERHLTTLAKGTGIDLDQAATEASPGVRHNMPSTYNEWQAARKRQVEQ